MSGERPDWQPRDGERVRVVTSGEVGTVVHRTLTEWGWLCDVIYDSNSARRSHTIPELAPTEPQPS